MTNPDFVALAKAMGVHAIRCRNAAELPAKMKEFLEYDDSKPVLMECLVETNEHVFPMVSPDARAARHLESAADWYFQVPAGKALHEQLLHPTFRAAYDAAKKA